MTHLLENGLIFLIVYHLLDDYKPNTPIFIIDGLSDSIFDFENEKFLSSQEKNVSYILKGSCTNKKTNPQPEKRILLTL